MAIRHRCRWEQGTEPSDGEPMLIELDEPV